MSLTLPRWPVNFLTTRLVSVSTTSIVKSSRANANIPLEATKQGVVSASPARVPSIISFRLSPLSVQFHLGRCSIQLQLLLLFFGLEAPEHEQTIRAWGERQLVQAVDGDSSDRPAVGWDKKILTTAVPTDSSHTRKGLAYLSRHHSNRGAGQTAYCRRQHGHMNSQWQQSCHRTWCRRPLNTNRRLKTSEEGGSESRKHV